MGKKYADKNTVSEERREEIREKLMEAAGNPSLRLLSEQDIVSAADPDSHEYGAVLEELDSLLPRADVVALTLPHTPQTVGLMDARRIDLMKEDAILISAGRGSVLDQEALARAMQGGKLWGAALDVTVPEPLPADSPLWDIPNLLLTPHVAGGMRLEVTRRTCIQMAQDNLRRYLAGEPLVNRVR